MSKMKPCTIFNRHKWQWHKTITTGSIGKHTAVLSRKTMYKCQCGEIKIAPLDPNTAAYERAKAE